LRQEGANQKNARTTLKEVVGKPGDPLRDGLSGLLRTQILSRLEDAKNEGGKVFAAPYEPNDPELLDGLRRSARRPAADALQPAPSPTCKHALSRHSRPRLSSPLSTG
jgi:hypothetical protein